MDTLANPGAEPVAVRVLVEGNLGSDLATQVVGESSGDGRVDADDDGFATDDADLVAGDPTVALLFGDANAALRPTAVPLERDTFEFAYDLVVPPGETVYLMHLAAQHQTPADALADVAVIGAPEAAQLVGLRPDIPPETYRRAMKALLAEIDGLGFPIEGCRPTCMAITPGG